MKDVWRRSRMFNVIGARSVEERSLKTHEFFFSKSLGRCPGKCRTISNVFMMTVKIIRLGRRSVDFDYPLVRILRRRFLGNV